MTHLELARFESEGANVAPFERWCAYVEHLLGHDLDGDQNRDGYSVDYARDAYVSGVSAKNYAVSVHAS